MKDLRDALRHVIEEGCYSKTLIAAKVHLTPTKLSNILYKKRSLYADEMLNLCEALKMSPEELQNYSMELQTKGDDE